MILVTGATGTIGTELVRLLAAEGVGVRAMTRKPSSARMPSGVDVVGGDFADPAALDLAVAGVSAVFLLTAPTTAVATHDEAMLVAARRAGVSRVVKLSAIATGDKGPDGEVIGAWHVPGEQALRDSGLAWTLLRPTTFASNTLSWAPAIARGEPVLNLSGDGRQGVVDPRDVAAVAAATLTEAGHEGQTYTLTGPDLLSVPDQAAVLTDLLGRPVRTVEPTPAQARRQLIAAGMTESFADGVISGSAYVREGLNAVVTTDVRRILGRAATSYRTWASDHQAAFRDQPPADLAGAG